MEEGEEEERRKKRGGRRGERRETSEKERKKREERRRGRSEDGGGSRGWRILSFFLSSFLSFFPPLSVYLPIRQIPSPRFASLQQSLFPPVSRIAFPHLIIGTERKSSLIRHDSYSKFSPDQLARMRLMYGLFRMGY